MENFDLAVVVTTIPEPQEIRRSVELTNQDWDIILQSLEGLSSLYRERQSQVIATYVTRGQLPEAVLAAKTMNELLMKIDQIQALIA
jgi:hypothetical protein